MIDKDQERNIPSLLKYHMTGLRLLGMCAAGKLNQSAKDECTQIPEITLQKCIEGFLDIDLKQHQTEREGEARVQNLFAVFLSVGVKSTSFPLAIPELGFVTSVQVSRTCVS